MHIKDFYLYGFQENAQSKTWKFFSKPVLTFKEIGGHKGGHIFLHLFLSHKILESTHC